MGACEAQDGIGGAPCARELTSVTPLPACAAPSFGREMTRMSEAGSFRSVPARILTPIGWMSGNLTVPRIVGLLEWLGHAGPFLRLSSVRLPRRDTILHGFALRRESVVMLIPGENVPTHAVPGLQQLTETHDVTCLFAEGLLTGQLTLPTSATMREYLLHHDGFLALHSCTIHLAAHFDQPEDLRPHPCVLVNAARLIGAAEGGSAGLAE